MNATEEIGFVVQLEPDDYVRTQRLHLKPRPWILWAGIVVTTIGSLGIVVAILRWLSTGQGLIPILVCIAGVSWIPPWFLVIQPWAVRRIFRQQKLLGMPFSMTMTDRGLQTTAEYGTGLLTWEIIHTWKEDGSLLLLYQSDAVFHMLPKRFFPSPQATDRLRELLKERVGPPHP